MFETGTLLDRVTLLATKLTNTMIRLKRWVDGIIAGKMDMGYGSIKERGDELI